MVPLDSGDIRTGRMLTMYLTRRFRPDYGKPTFQTWTSSITHVGHVETFAWR